MLHGSVASISRLRVFVISWLHLFLAGSATSGRMSKELPFMKSAATRVLCFVVALLSVLIPGQAQERAARKRPSTVRLEREVRRDAQAWRETGAEPVLGHVRDARRDRGARIPASKHAT